MRNLLKQLRNWVFPVSEQQVLSQILTSPWNNYTASGISLTPESMLTVSAIWQACSIIAHPLSTMEFKVYRRSSKGKRVDRDNKLYELLNWRPNNEQNSLKLRETLMLHVLVWGNGYIQIVRDKVTGEAIELWNLDPRSVNAHRTKRGDLYYTISGKAGRYLPEDIIHISRMAFDGIIGYSLTQIGKEGIALAKGLELFGATFFGNNCLPSGFITSDKAMGNPEQTLQYEQELNRTYGGLNNANKIKVLKPGQVWTPASTAQMGEQSQFTASRSFQIKECCRYMNLSPSRVGEGPEPTDVEAYNTLFYQVTIQPWAELIEAEFNSKLITDIDRRTIYAELDFSSMLRANGAARADYFTKMNGLGAITTNQIIEREDLGENIGPAGDQHMVAANNMQSLEFIYQQMQKPQAQEPQAEPEKTPVIAAARGLDAVRTVVEESINRMVRRETEAISRYAGKAPDEFRSSVETFYGKHAAIVRENISPAVRAFVAVADTGESAEALIDAITSKLCDESKAELLATTDVTVLLDDWLSSKAQSITEVL